MKSPRVLRSQHVVRKDPRIFHAVWRMVRLLFSGAFRLCLLLLILGVVSVSFLSLYQYLLTSPYLKLKQMDIRGSSPEIREELIRICDVGAEAGLLALDLEEIKTKMERHPWVRSATLERRFPDTLIAEIEMEAPSAVVLMDRLYFVNRYGEVFKEVEPRDAADYPIVTGLSATGPQALEELRRALAVMAALEMKGSAVSLDKLSEVHMKADGELSLFFKDLRAEIKLSSEGHGLKVAALRKVVAHLKQSGRIQQVTGIDLEHRDGAVVSFGRG